MFICHASPVFDNFPTVRFHFSPLPQRGACQRPLVSYQAYFLFENMRFIISLLFLSAVAVEAGDFGMIGLQRPEASKLLKKLVEHGHRVACFDAQDSALGKVFMRLGGISSFSEEAVIKFATPVVLVLDDRDVVKTLIDAYDVKGKVFVVWSRPKDAAEITRLETAASVRGCSIMWGVWDNDAASLVGNAKLKGIPGVARLEQALEKLAAVEVEDGGLLKKRLVPCPEQNPGGPTVWVSRHLPQDLGCSDTQLSVCRVFVRVPTQRHRVHAVALYNVDGPISTTDPEGFFHAFNSSVVPQDQAAIDLTPNGACDSFITFGVVSGQSCAQPDPSFNREAFLKQGMIAKETGWFCSNPMTSANQPLTAAKPPNTDDSILIAQFTTRRPHSVTGQILIMGAGPNKETSQAVQRFNCDCDTESN